MADNITSIFGCNVFNDSVMRNRLPEKVYKEFRKTVKTGAPLSEEVADVIAECMKNWAMEHGATHYTHWFQPLTGVTAEKHDGFIEPDGNCRAIMSFTGSSLIKGEPDASSFPSGGIRATFEARGYTAWDCSSPAFLKKDQGATVLCIPTAFCSYTGEALDKKTPLLRSAEAISKQAVRVLRALGDAETKRVISTVGAEQEYFLIDKKSYASRKDLIITGRTLFGAKPPKGQEMEDHYFGIIRDRVSEFMHDVNMELYKLGVFAKTEHNEVAPCQHELACIYSESNIATDHNQLVMETLKRVALRHDLVCLLHEKPFDGINGSGKHNNWALSTDGGENLLKPGKNPQHNTRFMLFLSAVIEAVNLHGDLLRASAANVGNDHRLGGNEAPPSIISVYLGDELAEVVNAVIEGREAAVKGKEEMEFDVAAITSIDRDTTDRNRTSPFAFTGNKFEFRMVGSSASIAGPNTVINTIVADSLKRIADRLEAASDVEAEAQAVIKELLANNSRIIFNGNGYSQEWVEEAARRGLPNLPQSIDAYPAYITDKAIKLFGDNNVYSEVELRSRYEVKVEKFVKVTNYEALTMLDMARQEIVPAVGDYAKYLAESIASMEAVGAEAVVEKEILAKVNPLYKELYEATKALDSAIKASAAIENLDEQAKAYKKDVIGAMDAVRKAADSLELIVAKEFWPMETYSDILFYQ
ncbi:MAG: glutamine synthetase III [Clostridia bacterium]